MQVLREILIIAVSLPFLTLADDYTPCVTNCSYQASKAQLENMELRLYQGQITQYTDVKIVNATSLIDKIDETKPSVIFIHGWVEFIDPGGANAVCNAYLVGGNYNVLFLNWTQLSSSEYIYAARSVEGIGYYLAKALNDLVAVGFNYTNLHIVGHSLGAQVASHILTYTDFNISRITGLDPAGPLFYGTVKKLSSGDADFVQIIHTDRGVLGIDENTGDVDFNPNGGVNIQPGCLLGLSYCSHYRAVFYYAESVTYATSFIARKCNTYVGFINGSCSSTEEVVMGYGTPTTARGIFYLQTASFSPFGLGESGATYGTLSVLGLVRNILFG